MSAIRRAQLADLLEIEALDALCFPAGDPDLEPADPKELADGVANQRILVMEEGSRVAAFLHYESPTSGHIYLSALAVHPDFQGRGLARQMMDDFLSKIRHPEDDMIVSLSTVTSLSNLRMISLLLSSGFVIRTVIEGYFGPGRDRVYCQLKVRIEYVDPDERYIIPINAAAAVDRLLRDDRYVITSLVRLPAGPAFEFSKFDADDFAALEASETAAGLGFSGVILGAIAFLLGFSFASPNYPDAARTLLTGAAFATTVSLIVYANNSGESARIRSNAFNYFIKWGNILSEYGGVLPFLIALPITLAGVTNSLVPGIVSGAVFSAGLWAYEASRFSMSSRFVRTYVTRVCAVFICSSPLSGVLLINVSWAMWIWTAVTSLALFVLACIYLFRRPDEQAMEPHRDRWEPRR